MDMRFTLTLNNAVVQGEMIDALVIDWTQETNHDNIMQISRDWNEDGESVARNMVGLMHVGEMSLSIEAT